MLKVLHVANTVSESSASFRLFEALRLTEQVEQDFLTLETIGKYIVPQTPARRLGRKINRKVQAWMMKGIRGGGIFHVAPVSYHDRLLPSLLAFDILHFHWINFELFPQSIFRQLVTAGKTVVITLHDSFWFTAGCHVRAGCTQYALGDCQPCPLFNSPKRQDFVAFLFQQRLKGRVVEGCHITAPSSHHARLAAASPLMLGQEITVLRNTLHNGRFLPFSKEAARDLLSVPSSGYVVVGIGAVNVRSNPYKGWAALERALGMLQDRGAPSMPLLILTFGESDVGSAQTFRTVNVGSLQTSYQLRLVYSAMDVFVNPSLEESFGQTTLEALSCGRPVVTFDNTGAVDVVRHQDTGYLARWDDAEDLSRGIQWTIQNLDGFAPQRLHDSVEAFSYETVGQEALVYYQKKWEERHSHFC